MAEANGVDHVLHQSVAAAREALEDPAFAPHYSELLEAERLGANRQSMVAELETRGRDARADKVLEQTIPQLTTALSSGMRDDDSPAC